MSTEFDTNLTDYRGAMEAALYELTAPGDPIVTNLIRTDQKWGVKIDWTMKGNLAEWINAQFHLRLCMESIGTHPEYELPVAGPVEVATLSVPLKTIVLPGGGVEYQRCYSQQIEFDPAEFTIAAGPYKPVTLIQLYDDEANQPVSVCAAYEGTIVTFYTPHSD
jgi:hypothetical protein